MALTVFSWFFYLFVGPLSQCRASAPRVRCPVIRYPNVRAVFAKASARASGNRAREACVLLSLADALA